MKVRKLAVALALAGGLGSGFAHALGMGEGRILTDLNEPLRAEIQLVRPGEVSTDQIRVSLASEEDFERAGVNKMHFLRELDFEVTRQDDGQLLVEVTTDGPVREPFLNFLVELTWPSGRMLREYSFLVDPPEARAPDEAEAPATEVTAEPEPVPEAEPAEPPEEAERTYGPTSSNDTLWAIAGEVAPSDDVSRQQVMLALQDLNPDAFAGENINRLRQGHVLRIPTEEQVRSRSVNEAVSEVMAQNEAMEAAAPDEAVVDATEEEAAPDPAAVPDEAAPDEDELRIMVAEDANDEEGTIAGMGPGEAEGELAVALEELDRAERDRDEMSERVAELEEQIDTMEQLIELKDDQLAEMQERLAAAEEEAPEVAVDPDEEAPEPDEVAEPEPEPAPEEEPEVAEAPEPDPVVDEAVEDEEEAPALTLGAIFDRLRTDPLWQAGAGGVGIGLLALLWALARRNAAREKAFYDDVSDFSDEDSDSEDFLGLGGEGDEAEVDAEAADGEAQDTAAEEQDDVVAEADVYMAYGRLDQAAQHLEEAISREPSRSDLRLKLLEVYAESGDSESFEKQYRELAAMEDEEAVAQANQLWSKLGPDEDVSIDDLAEELKTGSSADDLTGAAEADTTEEQQSEEESFDLEWDLDEPSVDEKSEESELPVGDIESAEEASADSEDSDDGIDFSLDDLDLDTESGSGEEAQAGEAAKSPEDELEPLELDEELGEEVPELSNAGDSEAADELEDLGLELESEDDSLPTADDIATDESDSTSLQADWDGEEELLEPEQDEQAASEASQPEEPAEAAAPDTLSAPDEASDFDDSFLEELDAELDKVTEEEQEADVPSSSDAESSELEDLELDVSEDDLALMDEVASGGEAEPDTADQQDGAEPSRESEEAALDNGDQAETLTDSDDEGLLDLELEGDTQAEEISGEETRALEEEGFVADPESGDWAEDAETSESESGVAPVQTADEPEEVDSEKAGESAFAQGEEDDEFDFLEGTDEAATKLDLARAYMEMGDADGARDILEEVASEGNDAQKKEASELLADL